MPRKRNDLLDDIAQLPWWVITILAVVVFVSLKFILPNIEIKNPLLNGMAKGIPVAAPLFTIALLFLAAKSAYSSWRKGELLESQKSIQTVRAVSWKEFEELVGEMYRRKGYSVTENARAGADGGVDLVLKKNGEVIFVQCKHWRMEKVGVTIARELYGVMMAEGATEGIVISSGDFTQEAKDFVKGKPISVVNGPELVEMVKAGQRKEINERMKTVENVQSMMKCPLCGGEMVLRTAKRGENAGGQFWGCLSFPRCRGVRES